MSRRIANGWILSPRGDLLVFGGPIVLSAALVLAFARAGSLDAPVPLWAYGVLILGCDVAHVYATLYRTYLDPVERVRRRALFTMVPLLCLVAGVALHAMDPLWFWRVLAYLAVFHFVRQQWGWMAYSARRAGETSRLDRAFDRAAIYAATIYPLFHWHARLPRDFTWFVDGDFVAGVPAGLDPAARFVHFAILLAWVCRQVALFAKGRPVNLAKALILSTTWLAWYGGIVFLDSDLAFTATNVLSHGIPYFAVVHRWGGSRFRGDKAPVARLFRPGLAFLGFYALLLAFAILEEGAWDVLYLDQDHRHSGLFPLASIPLDEAMAAVVAALLAVPQATHYVLDAFLWRTGPANPDLARHLGLSAAPAPN